MVPKGTPPYIEMVFLGVVFNTTNMIMSVTEEMVQEVIQEVSGWRYNFYNRAITKMFSMQAIKQRCESLSAQSKQSMV